MRAATAAAILAFCANHAIAAPIREAKLEDLTPELCKSLSFPDVFPPTPAEQRCKELLGEVDGTLPKLPLISRRDQDLSHLTKELCSNLKFLEEFVDSPIHQKCKELLDGVLPELPVLNTRKEDADLSHLTAEICKTLAFPMIFPPTPAQQKCEELTKEAEGTLPNVPRSEEDQDLSHLTADICKTLAFPMIFPPTPAQQKCDQLLKEAEKDIPESPALNTRSEEEDLSHLTADLCKTMLFPMIFPPTPAQVKCDELLKETENDLPELPVLSSRSEEEEDLSHLTASKCRTMAFLDVMPPTPAELKCRELLKENPNVLARSSDEPDLSHLTKEICENSAFLMIYPPTPAELKCREILGQTDGVVKRDVVSVKRTTVEDLTPEVCKTLDLKGPVKLPEEIVKKCSELLNLKLPILRKREEDLSHLTAEICKDLAFPAIFPPMAAELKCRELLGEEVDVQ